jgi:hypothetical protein
LDPKIEMTLTSIAQKRRKRLVDLMRDNRENEIIIRPYQKNFKGENVENFRGSKFRGISKNGNSW